MGTQAHKFTFDEFEDQDYDESLYRYDNVASGVDSLDDITDEHVRYYRDNGFLAIQNAFTLENVASLLDAIYYLIDDNNPDYSGVQYESSLAEGWTPAHTPKRDGVRKLYNYVDFEPRLKALSEENRLLEVVSKLIGANPELFVSQAFMKPSGIGREKPWHQDHAFFDLPIGTPITSCWIALDEATPENGCMHVKPGTHNEGPSLHFRQRDFQICDTHLDLSRDVMVPMTPGGMMFFDGLLHHGTPANRSSTERRSIQLTYVPEGTPRITPDERLTYFGGDGSDVTC